MTTKNRRHCADIAVAQSHASSCGQPSCGTVSQQRDDSRFQLALAAAIRTTGLRKRDVTVGDRRTTMKLDDTTWRALTTVARLEGVSIDHILTQVDQQMNPTLPLTAAIRVFVVEYMTLTSSHL